jgi:hypothetical protein
MFVVVDDDDDDVVVVAAGSIKGSVYVDSNLRRWLISLYARARKNGFQSPNDGIV